MGKALHCCLKGSAGQPVHKHTQEKEQPPRSFCGGWLRCARSVSHITPRATARTSAAAASGRCRAAPAQTCAWLCCGGVVLCCCVVAVQHKERRGGEEVSRQGVQASTALHTAQHGHTTTRHRIRKTQQCGPTQRAAPSDQRHHRKRPPSAATPPARKARTDAVPVARAPARPVVRVQHVGRRKVGARADLRADAALQPAEREVRRALWLLCVCVCSGVFCVCVCVCGWAGAAGGGGGGERCASVVVAVVFAPHIHSTSSGTQSQSRRHHHHHHHHHQSRAAPWSASP